MAVLRKTGESQYEVLADGQTVGQCGTSTAVGQHRQGGETYHGHKSWKQAVERVEWIHQFTKERLF